MPDLRGRQAHLSATLLDGRYRLGPGRWEGAVGVVREAFDTLTSDRRVVIKHPDPYQGPEARAYKERLLDVEANALTVLSSVPQVCKMLARGRIGRGPGSYRYLVIEWADGESVMGMVQHAAAQGKSLPIGTSLLILTQLGHVLSEAHRNGLINNDVDIKHLYWNDGRAALKMIDWGNAKDSAGPDWGRFGYRDDLVQYADVMFCMLTGRAELDVKQADLATWREACSEVLAVVRDDLCRVGTRLSSRDGGYESGLDLYEDLEACLASFRDYMRDDLETVDYLLGKATPESIAQADHVLKGLCQIAPVDPTVVQRREALSRLRRERKEVAALQLGSAYVKAGSWLDAVEVLYKTFGEQAQPDSNPALLLSAAKLVDSRRSQVSKATQRQWASAARAISDRKYDEALDAYLAVRSEWFDTRVEPIHSLLGLTGRYVLRHELVVLDGALSRTVQSTDRGNGSGANSRHGTNGSPDGFDGLRLDISDALSGLSAAGEHDWAQQRRCYRRIAKALEACADDATLPASLARQVRQVRDEAQDLLRSVERADRALSRLDLQGAAKHMERVPKVDPDNTSPLAQARVLRRLQPTFDRIQQTTDWHVGLGDELERRAVSDIEVAFAPLSKSSLKRRVIALARKASQTVAADLEAEILEEGLAPLRERRWPEASRWASQTRQQHPRWVEASFASKVAGAYRALFERQQSAQATRSQVDGALRELDHLTSENEELRQHKKRLEAVAECARHLFAAEEDERVLAPIAIENLPAGDPFRDQILRGIDLTGSLRQAVHDSEWCVASEVSEKLASAEMPIMSRLAGEWRGALAEAAEGITLAESRRRPEAVVHLDAAISRLPAVDLGRPAPLASAVKDALRSERDSLRPQPTSSEQGLVQARQVSQDAEAEPETEDVERVEAMTHSIQDGCSRLSDLLRQGQIERSRDLGETLRTLICTVTEHLHRLVEGNGTRVAGHVTVRKGGNGQPLKAGRLGVGNGTPDPKREAMEPLGWAMGGAAVVVVIVLVLVLALSNRGASGESLEPGASVDEYIAQITDLAESGDREAASALYDNLQGQDLAGLSEEQAQAVASIDDYFWLWGQSAGWTDDSLGEDFSRLERLWVARQEGRMIDEAESVVAVETAVRARWDRLQSLLSAGSRSDYDTVIAALDGLEDASVSVVIAPGAFRSALTGAYAGSARMDLAASDCAAASRNVDHLTRIVGGDASLAESVHLVSLSSQVEVCRQSQTACQALSAMASEDQPEYPGDDLLRLARIAAEAGNAAFACDGVSVEQMVASRLGVLAAWLDRGDYAAAGAEALKMHEDGWFSQPPVSDQPSPAEIAISAYALWTQQACAGDVCGEHEDSLLTDAEAFYARYKPELTPEAQARIEGLLAASRESCAACQSRLGSDGSLETESLSLLDEDIGAWADHGIYYGDTADGRAYHLNDVFLKREVSPLMYGGEEGSSQYALYTTNYSPAGGALQGIAALHVQTKVLSVKGLDEDTRPLWGVRVPGSEADARYVVVLWTPARDGGAWSLVDWVPSRGVLTRKDLPQGPPDMVAVLDVVLGRDVTTYDVRWQGSEVLAGQPLPAPAPHQDVQLLIGEGVHVWIQDAELEMVR